MVLRRKLEGEMKICGAIRCNAKTSFVQFRHAKWPKDACGGHVEYAYHNYRSSR